MSTIHTCLLTISPPSKYKSSSLGAKCLHNNHKLFHMSTYWYTHTHTHVHVHVHANTCTHKHQVHKMNVHPCHVRIKFIPWQHRRPVEEGKGEEKKHVEKTIVYFSVCQLTLEKWHPPLLHRIAGQVLDVVNLIPFRHQRP